MGNDGNGEFNAFTVTSIRFCVFVWQTKIEWIEKETKLLIGI